MTRQVAIASSLQNTVGPVGYSPTDTSTQKPKRPGPEIKSLGNQALDFPARGNQALGNQTLVKALLIDDQPIVAESISRLLAAAPDIEFYYCEDAQQAMAMTVDIQPTVILQDLVMPGTNGLKLVQQFREHPAVQRIPVVVLSTQCESTLKAEAFAAGANDYLVKVPDAIELIARLRYHSSAYTNLLNSLAAEHTRAYNKELERRVAERTAELETALSSLRQAQTQLIQDEKMSSLGQLVAGVAHEINNPVNFIYGNLRPAQQYAKDLLYLVELYQQEYPQPTEIIQETLFDLDLPFLAEDFPKLLSSLRVGAQRIQAIVKSLRNFSRLDEAITKRVDIHEGIDNTLLILTSKLHAIEIIKDYGDCPLVDCLPSQLNQVFMNIIVNAAEALAHTNAPTAQTQHSPTICIQTRAIADASVQITVTDNGPGMTEDTLSRIFDPFFTTKPVGSGTGLGLSISYQIITARHRGTLACHSTVGEGTAFVIQLPTTVTHNCA